VPRSTTTQRPPARQTQSRPSESRALATTQAGLDRRQEQVNHPLVKYIEQAMPRIEKLLPAGVNSERFGALVLQSLIANPDILQCTPESVIQAVLEAAQDGLEPTGARGGAWLVKFGNEAQLIRDYRGVIRLIVGSGSATRVDAQEVRRGEAFSFQPAMPDPIRHEIPAVRETEVLGAYALFWLPDGSKKAEYMTAAEIETTRQKSKAPGSLMWKDFWGQGARKTVIKRGANYLDLRPEIRAKLVTEDEAEFGGAVTVSPVAPDLVERRQAIAERTARLTGGSQQEQEKPEAAAAKAEPAAAAAPEPTLEEAQKAVYAAAKEADLLEALPKDPKSDEYQTVLGDNWTRLDELAAQAIPDKKAEELVSRDWLFLKDRIEAGDFADSAK
jgi:recombination protein RecT